MAANGEELTEADQLLADQVAEWSTNTNEAFTVHFIQGDREVEVFNPEFTYPIYGDEEVIFGYQDLSISLAFAAHNLRPHLSVNYARKWTPRGEIRASDVREPLRDFLPPAVFSKDTSRESALADPGAAKFVPPGEKLESFDTENGTYEVWCASLTDARAKEILQNVQILVPMFIEGGTVLELEYPWIVERWKVFFLYKVTPEPSPNVSPYVFAGYATAFQVFALSERGDVLEAELKPNSETDIDRFIKDWSDPEATGKTPLSLPSRERISQFILLPAHQGSGLGSRLYSAVYSKLTAPSNITELTVEDPNEAFDDMRDICDLNHLRASSSTFAELTISTSIPASSLSAAVVIPTSIIVPDKTRRLLAQESKIQTRQLSRLIEMQLLSTIPRLHRSASRITRRDRATNAYDRAYYFWRLLVKERLYQHNRDTLIQLEPQDRIEKVEQAAESVRSDYERLIDTAERRAKIFFSGRGKGRKRASDDVDDDMDDEDGQQRQQLTPLRKKRLRVVDDDDEEAEEDQAGEADGAEDEDEEGEDVDVDDS
ncbi:hypothetical protein ANO11243_052850 [Dothideomycetidae sp. 11243]|nr:hypothetical protein ANO11243_052850 [fungal sp. No.11243]